MAIAEATLIDIGTLLDQGMLHASKSLKDSATFVPFVVLITRDNSYSVIVSHLDATADDHQALYAQMVKLAGQGHESREVRASATGVRVSATLSKEELPQDCLLLEVEHEDGTALKYFVPIDKKIFGPPRLGEPVIAPHPRRFVKAPAAAQDGQTRAEEPGD